MNIFTKLSLQLQLSLEEYFQQEMIDFDRDLFKVIFPGIPWCYCFPQRSIKNGNPYWE